MAKISKSKDCVALLQTLISYKDVVLDLPTSSKKSECTMMRFFLYLLPVINIALKSDKKVATEIFT